jgi:hypothetical protein
VRRRRSSAQHSERKAAGRPIHLPPEDILIIDQVKASSPVVASEKPKQPHFLGPEVGEALMAKGEEREKKIKDAVAKLQAEMEVAGERIRSLVLAQPPTGLLGYLWSQFFVGTLTDSKADGGDAGPDRDRIQQFQLVLEYVHAVWSSHQDAFAAGQVDEVKAQELMAECEKLGEIAMFYAMASSRSGATTDLGDASGDMEFHAKSSWVLIRGHRYQVLEREFFEFALSPHDEPLSKAYSVGAVEIAHGLQSIADAMRAGYSEAAEKVFKRMEESRGLVEAEGISLKDAVAKMKLEDAGVTPELEGAFRDMFFGGICNLSRHTKLPESLLADLSYRPGQEDAFYADGPLKGTPFRTLPARVRPLVKLNDGYYATDGQFVRDSAYRSIQRGLIARLPGYREGWNKNQKTLTETAFPKILARQLRGARLFEEVYFKDGTGAWAETDLVGIIDDVLFLIEAKAGVMAMQSPATNFESHVRTIRELVLKAYRQCKRFLDYLASGENMPIYRLRNGNYEEVAKINIKTFRSIFPVGLTVEAFTPFSSMCKTIPEVAPIHGRHAFVSMSVDDLFVLDRFLPSAGEFFHYLQVRQAVASMPRAMMFDEIDHLGAYVVRNRFDQDMRQQLERADIVAWDSFSEVVDRHFAQEKWESSPVPHQIYPAEIAQVLELLDGSRPEGWLRIDGAIRDYDATSRNKLASILGDLAGTLRATPVRRFLFGNELPIQIWLTREKTQPIPAEMQRQGEIACLAAKVSRVLVLRLQCDENGKPLEAQCSQVAAPPIIRNDYPTLLAEAERQRARLANTDKPHGSKKKR